MIFKKRFILFLLLVLILYIFGILIFINWSRPVKTKCREVGEEFVLYSGKHFCVNNIVVDDVIDNNTRQYVVGFNFGTSTSSMFISDNFDYFYNDSKIYFFGQVIPWGAHLDDLWDFVYIDLIKKDPNLWRKALMIRPYSSFYTILDSFTGKIQLYTKLENVPTEQERDIFRKLEKSKK